MGAVLCCFHQILPLNIQCNQPNTITFKLHNIIPTFVMLLIIYTNSLSTSVRKIPVTVYGRVNHAQNESAKHTMTPTLLI